jgi:protein-tyrosine phosphatase
MHCGAGIGRAGTIATALLLSMGVRLDDALVRVAAARPMAGPEAGAQADFLAAIESGQRIDASGVLGEPRA